MKRNSIFLVNSTHKTKTWWTFLSVLVLVFVPFLIVWLLCCEFNLLDTNWLIAQNSSVWHGVIQADQVNILAQKYGMFYKDGTEALLALLNQNVGQSKSIVSYTTFFNPIVLAPLLGLLVWSIIYPIIFNATKVSGLDVLPFSFGIGSIMFATIISGLIPQWGSNLLVLYWIVRILIGFVVGAIAFIIANQCINKFLSSRDYAFDIYFGYKVNDASTKAQREQLKENVDIFKHNKAKDKDYVEVEQEVK